MGQERIYFDEIMPKMADGIYDDDRGNAFVEIDHNNNSLAVVIQRKNEWVRQFGRGKRVTAMTIVTAGGGADGIYYHGAIRGLLVHYEFTFWKKVSGYFNLNS